MQRQQRNKIPPTLKTQENIRHRATGVYTWLDISAMIADVKRTVPKTIVKLAV